MKPSPSRNRIGYPVLVRPSFVLGGRAMEIVHEEQTLRRYMRTAAEASPERPMLVDRFLEDATEVDVDCIADGETCVIGGVMEHIEQAGIHSGDSACVIPTFSLSTEVLATIKNATKAMARELEVRGLMNVQFAVKDEGGLCARSQPARVAHRPVREQGHRHAAREVRGQGHGRPDAQRTRISPRKFVPEHYSVKEAVFPS